MLKLQGTSFPVNAVQHHQHEMFTPILFSLSIPRHSLSISCFPRLSPKNPHCLVYLSHLLLLNVTSRLTFPVFPLDYSDLPSNGLWFYNRLWRYTNFVHVSYLLTYLLSSSGWKRKPWHPDFGKYQLGADYTWKVAVKAVISLNDRSYKCASSFFPLM